jgi:hypothetical protein
MKIGNRIEASAVAHPKRSEIGSVDNVQRRCVAFKFSYLQCNRNKSQNNNPTTVDYTLRSTSRDMRSNGKLSSEVRPLKEISRCINDVASFQLRFNDGPSRLSPSYETDK